MNKGISGYLMECLDHYIYWLCYNRPYLIKIWCLLFSFLHNRTMLVIHRLNAHNFPNPVTSIHTKFRYWYYDFVVLWKYTIWHTSASNWLKINEVKCMMALMIHFGRIWENYCIGMIRAEPCLQVHTLQAHTLCCNLFSTNWVLYWIKSA